MKELQQRKLFIQKHFIIRRGGVECYKKNLETDTYEFIAFSDFEERKKSRRNTVKYPALFFIGLFIVLLGLVRASLLLDANYQKSILAGGLTILVGVIIIFIYRLVQIRYVLIPLEDDKQLYMLSDNPNTADFEAFVDAMYEARKRNYRETYFYINEENDKRTELSRMKWLLNENIITEEEYEDMIDEINLRFM